PGMFSRAWLVRAAALGVFVSAGSSQPREVTRFEVLREPVALPDGRLMAVGIRLIAGQQQVSSRDSADDWATWSKPHRLFTLPRREGGFGFYRVFLDRAGELHLFLLCDANSGAALPRSPDFPGPSDETLDIWHVRSKAQRTTWLPPHRIWRGRAGDL